MYEPEPIPENEMYEFLGDFLIQMDDWTAARSPGLIRKKWIIELGPEVMT